MNPDDGRTVLITGNAAELAAINKNIEERGERPLREWVQFSRGEIVNVKGIDFKVHEVGDQRLVLKFANKQER